jgi:hypothetical protein
MIVRQGDVYAKTFESLPQGAVPIPRDNGRVVLAYGEATGHAHAIADEGAELFSVPGTNDKFLRIMGSSGAILRHEQHAPVLFIPGVYRVRMQRECSPEGIRYVAD